MRWTKSDAQRPDSIVRSWFAIWPVTLQGETRWLEWVAVEYRDSPYFTGDGYTAYSYRPIRFIEE